MKKLRWVLLALAFPLLGQCENVGLCIMATGKYVNYATAFIDSARKYFCTGHEVTYFVFTDQPLDEAPDVVRVEQARLGWPFDTMMRNSIYYQHRELMENMDYIFASDADMLFVAEVGSELFSERVGTQHPGFVGRRGSYETNLISTAAIRPREGKTYFAGGFFGGSHDEFLSICKITTENIQKDLSNNYVAVWHDESHLNRYFINHPPTKILSPSYCYPESLSLPYTKKLLALDKNHTEMRK